MVKMAKKRKALSEKVEPSKKYGIDEAVALSKSLKYANFDESVDIAVNLGVDPTKADQMVRGSVVLPAGTGKSLKILVFAKGEKEVEAKDAGADFIGNDDYVEKIKGGWLGFDVAIATPDMMGTIGKVAKILGPRGLMPNPKSGTVTLDIAKAIDEVRKGKVEFRVDKGGVIHAPIGRASFDADKLKSNAMALLVEVQRLKPSTAKGKYLKGVTISTTMGLGVKVDETSLATTL